MKLEELIEIIFEALAEGKKIESLTLHPKDLIDLLYAEDIKSSRILGPRFLGIKIETSLKVPKEMVLINKTFLKSRWNPSSR